MEIQFLGHSAFLIKGSKTVLIDPFLTGNPMAAVKRDDVEPDYILVTHGHGDHLGDAVPIAHRTGAPVIAPNELALYCSEHMHVKAHAMHIGGGHHFDGLYVKLTAAIHGSAIIERGISDYLGLACGFIIKMDGKTIYHAGDTALFYDMKMVVGDLNDIDVAMLPIGDNYTMGPEDAAIAAGWLGAKTVIPMHYNTFPVIRQDPLVFKEKAEMANTGIQVEVLSPGGMIKL